MSSPESQEIWTKSDVYHNSFLIPKDEVFDKIVENNKASGLRDIAVTAAQGKFLHLIALSIGAKKILEVGTLGG
jgi:predicted O-methyltransferase YrrM